MLSSNLRSLHFISKPPLNPSLLSSYSYLHKRSLPPLKGKKTPINRNKNHSFFLDNPFLSILPKCNSLPQLKQIQAQMTIKALMSDCFFSSRLIGFCALSEHKNLDHCIKILYNLQNPNVFSWNVTIRGCAESENPKEAIFVYKQMLRNNDIYVHNGVIHFLVSTGELELASKVFDESCVRDLVSWNSLINGYVRSGRAKEAIGVYGKMQEEGVMPDEVTMIGIVSSCAQLEDLKLGRDFHKYIEDHGLNLTIPLSNALMDMYVKCGSLDRAQRIFDNMEKKTIVSCTTMVVGYARLGLLDAARKLFDEMPEKDVVPWNAIIGGYVQAKSSKEALALFHEMQAGGIKPDEVTMVYCLSACSQLGALDVGIWIHHYIEKHKLYLNVALGTALVDMYAKCGNITKALRVFHEMPSRNSLTWTSIIGGLALHGNGRDALSYFSEMIEVGLRPDEVTFLGVLSACCHGGLVEEGRKYFTQMTSKFGLSPQLKHYSCMVDLLGRAGLLDEAEELVKSMAIEPDAVVWGALFFACRMHGNFLKGERAALKLLELDPHDSGIYVLLANMYGDANMWEEAGKVRKMMRERGVEKTPGCSSIEVDGTAYEFIVRDTSHPESEQIYDCIIQLTRQLEFAEFTCGLPKYYNDFLVGLELET
ncbi:pentatricopeptide repeat-containing protein At2g22410, mitochondrial-like isoform X2 [Durio zibethinus]|uniref:Pentatricopeptide repeat-containing protein At2g22410, mitochondrial-like isoform X2 n=1 Tax=Durio zibethinus TaxID=66656 RepID=A0A6P5ZMX8_DURZI|nr:pentatricopeptide repeat-containing protein At2g22410, mitochondrial-like isoform X2 [Durio zibethinus]